MFKFLKFNLLPLLLFLVSPSNLGAQELNNNTIKVGVYDNSPKVFVNEQGVPAGIFVDLVEVIA